MKENSIIKPVYDLEERTLLFARNVRIILRKLRKDIINESDISQLIKSSGSLGANYIEANESLSKKDFYHRIKICRKEAKESAFWARLLMETNETIMTNELKPFFSEATELKKIFSSIIEKAKTNL